MKAILATLLCYLLIQAQCFAHKGGPFEGGKGQIPINGIYSAILIPTCTNCVGSNTLGLFTMTVPATGLASGTAFMFGFGASLTGTIQGAIDPKTAKLYAVFHTELDITVQQTIDTTVTYVFLANGQLTDNKIVAGKGFSMPRISGSANIIFSTSHDSQDDSKSPIPDFPISQQVPYTVLGFKQA
jgi:hypothetical protein